MWPTISISAIEDRWRPLADAERAVAEVRLADAEAEIRFRLRERGVTGTPGHLTTEEQADWAGKYAQTAADAVRRYLSNPEGWLEEREAIDDYDRTRRRDKTMSTGSVWIDPADIDALVPRPRRRRGAFSIRLGAK